MFEHASAMGDLASRQFLRRRFERQRILRPRLASGARSFNARPKTLKTDRVAHTNVVSHFGLHSIHSRTHGSRSCWLINQPKEASRLDLGLPSPVLQ
jgi:hypothetical protein